VGLWDKVQGVQREFFNISLASPDKQRDMTGYVMSVVAIHKRRQAGFLISGESDVSLVLA